MSGIDNMCRRLRALGYIVTPPKIDVKELGIGGRLMVLRKAHGYSLQDVADRVDASKAYVWEIEKGRTNNIGSVKILRFCALYNMSPNFILTGSESPSIQPIQSSALEGAE